MSDDAFHVHGLHDHQLEHAAEHGITDQFSGRIAVANAILATVGALFWYQGGATQADARHMECLRRRGSRRNPRCPRGRARLKSVPRLSFPATKPSLP
ncbi:MAG: hypothetical protein ABI277_02420 [Burkholderiaceae bacterium]